MSIPSWLKKSGKFIIGAVVAVAMALIAIASSKRRSSINEGRADQRQDDVKDYEIQHEQKQDELIDLADDAKKKADEAQEDAKDAYDAGADKVADINESDTDAQKEVDSWNSKV